MTELFHILLYQPLMNILIFLYQVIPGNDFGLAIITLTAFIRLVLYPLSAKGIKSQRAITDLQPEIKEIQAKYKDDKEKQVKEVLEVYKKAKVNPFSGFLPLLVQLPVLIALYRVLWGVQSGEFANILYSFISFPGEINSLFLGFIDLAKVGIFESNGETVFLFGNMLIIFSAGVAQFFQMKMVMAQKPQSKKKKKGKPDPMTDMAERMQKQMIYFFPFFTIFILFKLPLAIGLYWLASTLFSLVQQHFILNRS